MKRDFPILNERVHGRRLVWLDNAATTQKPRAVIDRLSYFYEHENSNVHRAAHALAARATDAYEAARDKTRRFLNAPSPKEIVFVRGTTEAINLVAQSWGRRNVGPGDEIVITWLEHHANIVPWQMLAAEKGARLRVAPVNDRGEVNLDELDKLLGPRTRIVSVSQVSNALGTVVPVRDIVAMGHRHGARVLVDGAQAVSHMAVDVQALDCDFYVFSGHKIFGPTGIGALYGKADVLEAMPPWQGGGNMISDVTFEQDDLSAAARPLRGGDRQHRGRGRVGGGARLRQRARPAQHQPPRARPARARDRVSWAVSRGCASSGRPPTRLASCPSYWTGFARRTWRPRSTRRGSRCAAATIVPSRSSGASAWRAPCARRWRCTTRTKTSRRWRMRCVGYRRAGRPWESDRDHRFPSCRSTVCLLS